jgi:transposase
LGEDVERKLVFIDETHKGTKEMRQRRHWVIRGKEQPFFKAKFFGRNDYRYSMIGVCDAKGFIVEACEVVQTVGTGEDVGPINRERFERFIREILLPVLGRYDFDEARSIVVLDNASIHHSEEIVNLIKSTGAEIVYLPPYSPDLNPIELMFGAYKKRMKRVLGYGWLTAHLVALQESVSPSTARNFFRHCHIPVRDEDEDGRRNKNQAILIAVSAMALFISLQMNL